LTHMPPLTAPAIGRPSSALSRNQLLQMFYYARLTRDVGERFAILCRQNKVVGGLYRSLGQEGELEQAFMPGVAEVVGAVRRLVRY
jgi:TPP-dependent pyruvate/acetoin dehydrogenase alpha subunit